MPRVLRPQLATLVKAPPASGDWLAEIKFDGYRMLLKLGGGKVRIVSRSGRDWTEKFPNIARAAARLPVKSAWIDGEAVVLDARGRSHFQLMQNALADPGRSRFVYYAFDLPYLDGYDLRGVPLRQRKRRLEALVAGAGEPLLYSSHIEGQAAAMLRSACKEGLEGIVAKAADSVYTQQRTATWLKVKCVRRQEMVVGGYSEPGGSRTAFGALFLGVYQPDGRLRYSGKVGTGFNEATLQAVYRKLKPLEIARPAFANPPKGAEARGAHWVKPQLVAEIAFTEWTDDGTLRHPSFQGLREDKNAREVVRETAAEFGS
ncbi:MAG TPA: non-homologous end-joining DNA ligase [Burkholderiales bacterium]|nr:non-homologous end-joining DNA ligase [Burkholderiales bacterium]